MKPPASFLEAGSYYINGTTKKSANKQVSERIFKSYFRLDPASCSDLWGRLSTFLLDDHVENGVKLDKCRPTVHLLWVLHYLYVYSSEEVCAKLFGLKPKTYREYVHAMICFLHALSSELVSLFESFLFNVVVVYVLTFNPRLTFPIGSTRTMDPNA